MALHDGVGELRAVRVAVGVSVSLGVDVTAIVGPIDCVGELVAVAVSDGL